MYRCLPVSLGERRGDGSACACGSCKWEYIRGLLIACIPVRKDEGMLVEVAIGHWVCACLPVNKGVEVMTGVTIVAWCKR